ncbi:hypothetical protein [Limnofasciculus baicalensis]|uniref:Uncharacterized protein n=1 Tax=Limnofasciculus baicalensis BBK-W-15 TaxID=2699891 RepID=A0AAE3GNI6_9CYAN|nr:hypothetical protein [Limnofasciculus baicalensis]MCP2726873.1 hypothetical protein [Limnofasciculus baicalensis BBK-W-15]
MEWPDHFPSGCPPQNANNASGEVYRLIKHDSPTPKDFKSWREENKEKDCPNGVTECQACGLSVYTEKADACRVIRTIPRFKKAIKYSGGILDQAIPDVAIATLGQIYVAIIREFVEILPITGKEKVKHELVSLNLLEFERSQP